MLWLPVAVVFQAIISPVFCVDNTCSAYVYPRVEVMDVKVVSILGMHDSYDGKCGTTYNAGALQHALALHFAADLINGNNVTDSFIPGIRFGVEVYDDCSTKHVAAYHAGALVSQTRCSTECSANQTASPLDVPVVGIIGTSISDTTTIVANMLEPTFIPVLGPSATIPELSNKTQYSHFTRVVPSDFKQIKVIVQLAKYFKWSYIIGLATSDNYGREGMAELVRQAKEQIICVSVIEDFDLFDDSNMEMFVRTTLAKKRENIKDNIGIVYFGLNDPLVRFLKFIEKKRSSWSGEDIERLEKIYWLASDAVQASQDLASSVSQFKTNILVVSPYLVNITSFKEYFIQFLRSPPAWVNERWKLAISNVVQNSLGCKLYNFTEVSLNACTVDEKLVFDAYIPSVLDAFFILANTVKAIHQTACNNVSGPCESFTTSLSNGLLKANSLLNLDYSTIKPEYLPPEFTVRKLQMISGDFEVINQPLYSLQAIKRGSFDKVAEFKGDTIVATSELNGIFSSSECKAVCKDCQSIGQISYLFYPGDVLLIGIFSIQWQSDQNPYKCDMYRETSTSYIALEAFISTVHQLKNITKFDFGYLIIDDCYNTLTLTRLLNGVMSGDITIQSSSGRKFNASQVAVAIGAQSSDVTLAALPILTELSIPMISYSATNPILDNRIIYPYFSRTVSSDVVQANAFVSILKYLQVTFVGAIVVENIYGLDLYELFRRSAELEGICVDDAVRVTSQTYDYNFNPVLEDYRSKKIQVIIIIAMEITIRSLLNTVKIEDTFVFLASDSWGPNFDIIRGDGGKKGRGGLVLGAAPVKLHFNIKKHLETLDPFGNASTIWLQDFWEDQFQCDMPGGFSKTHGGNICSKALHNMSAILDNLADSPLAFHAAMATMSAGLTISEFLRNNKQMPFNATEFTKALRLIKLSSASGEIRPFNDVGNSDHGFDVFNIQSSTDSKEYAYVKVGSFQDKVGLSIDKSLIKFYDGSGTVIDKVESSCSYHQQCSTVCGRPQGSVSPGLTTPNVIGEAEAGEASSKDTAVIILAVLLALFVLFTILLIVVGILTFTGKIHIKGRSLIRDNMESSGKISRVQKNTYSNPSGSSCGDICPQLPARKRTKKVVYTNKSFSDILPSDHGNTDEHITRDRSQSMPARPYHTVSSQQLMPVALVPPNVVLSLQNKSQIPDETQYRLMNNQLPVAVAYTTGSHDLGEPYGCQNPRKNNVYPVYANTTNGVNDPHFPQEEIIFQNVPDDSAIYRLTSPVDGKQNSVLAQYQPQTEYVQVQTPNGIIYIQSEDFQRMLQNTSIFENQSKLGHITEIPDQNTSQATDNPGTYGSYLHNFSEVPTSMPSTEYISPIHVIYGTQNTVPNPIGAKLSPENFTPNPPVNAVAYNQNNSTETSKISQISHICEPYTVNSSNYLLPRNLAQVIANMGTNGPPLAQGNTKKTLPVSLHQHPGLEMKKAARPNNLQVGPVYTQINPEIMPQTSQELTDQSERTLVGGISQENLSPHNHQNKNVNNKATLDGNNAYVAQSEQQKRTPDQYRPSQMLLSDLTEELEEIV